MSASGDGRAEVFRLIDAYCGGTIDDEGLRRLETILLADEGARRIFVECYQLHTELQFTTWAKGAATAALDLVAIGDPATAPRGGREPGRARRRMSRPFRRWATLAAGVLIAGVGFAVGHLGLTSRPGGGPGQGPARPAVGNVAWLVNAQDCLWAGVESATPGRDMRAGKTLRLERGLAEIEFDRGARLILQGPATLELVSGNAARLLRGAMTAHVPPKARGFTIESPQGKVIDLGTEFGLSIDGRGGTSVRVFEGTVEAAPLAGSAPAAFVTLHEDQVARIDGRTVDLRTGDAGADAARYVRVIEPPPVVTPRGRSFDFARPVPGTIGDAEGRGVGLTHRLPGTGAELPANDPNLRIDPARGRLELTTTRSDINTQVGLETGEYLGVRLSDFGFTGREDFSISALIPQIPGLASVGQFGLYAGSRSDKVIRGGLLSQPEPDRYLQFLVNNDGGKDSDIYEVGFVTTGDDLKITLRRIGGKYSLVVENLTKHRSSTLAIAHPAFLDAERDLHVGLFGANAQSDVRKTLTIKQFDVKVWTVSPVKPAAPAHQARSGRGMTECVARSLGAGPELLHTHEPRQERPR